jgi:positive regulator of sigma E activity
VSSRIRKPAYQPNSDDPLAHAVAMVIAPVLTGLLGAWLDSRFGTKPILMIAFAAFAVVGGFISAYYRYEHRMAEHDRDKPWARRVAS